MDLFRREIKFQISEEKMLGIYQFLEMYCEMDKYSARETDGYYLINSLYLDSERMQLLENKRKNFPRRFSVRIRSYGASPSYPAFFEIKRKSDHMIGKKRAKITRPETLEFLTNGGSRLNNSDLDQPFFSQICYHTWSLGLSPKVMTQYRRRAYFGVNEPYARVTFDRQLRCYPETEYIIFPDQNRFVNYDNEESYLSVKSNIVLELKCELKIPEWMKIMVRKFELKQSSFSKFDSSYTYASQKYPALSV
jgi:SPX domain protein involved in polyphosphate accumulation